MSSHCQLTSLPGKCQPGVLMDRREVVMQPLNTRPARATRPLNTQLSLRIATSRARRVTVAAFAGVIVLGVVLSGCAVPARAVTPTGGDRVVVVVSGTANEPRPAVTDAVRTVLRDAANSGNV